MTENPWTTPEAVAYFESEWQHAIKQAEEALDKACVNVKLWSGLCDWLLKEPYQVAAYIGRENYELFTELVTGMPLLAEENWRTKKKDSVA